MFFNQMLSRMRMPKMIGYLTKRRLKLPVLIGNMSTQERELSSIGPLIFSITSKLLFTIEPA